MLQSELAGSQNRHFRISALDKTTNLLANVYIFNSRALQEVAITPVRDIPPQRERVRGEGLMKLAATINRQPNTRTHPFNARAQKYMPKAAAHII